MKHIKCEQRSPEWYQMRLGIPTASDFHKILTPGGKISKQAENYMNTLLAEWVLGKPLDTVETSWMTRGTDTEFEAIQAAEFELEIETEPGGFFTNDAGTIGASPDRLIGANGVLELKSPAPQNQIHYLLTGELEDSYRPQLQGLSYVTEREYVTIFGYHPELPRSVMRVNRDERYIALLAAALNTFNKILAGKKEELERRFGPFVRTNLEPPAQEDAFGITEMDAAALVEHHELAGTWGVR